jgi:hypothetical protein
MESNSMKFISNGKVVAEIQNTGSATRLGPENGEITHKPVSVIHTFTSEHPEWSKKSWSRKDRLKEFLEENGMDESDYYDAAIEIDSCGDR